MYNFGEHVWQGNKICTCKLIDFNPILMFVRSRQRPIETCFEHYENSTVRPEVYCRDHN